MSHPLYNPYASGKRNSTQGQYGQTERDTQRPSSFLGHGSVFSSSGAPLAVPGNSGGRDMTRDMDAKSSMDMHISKGRKPMDSAPFTSAQRNEFRSSGAGIAAYPVTSASSSRYTNKAAIESGGNNLNWLTSCPGPSPSCSSSTLSNLAGGNGGRVDTSSKVQHDLRAIPGLGDYDSPGSGRSHPFTEPGQPKYTSESAVSILQRFGLEKEDLEHLISYPENQITPANLPFILREIRLQKDKKAVTGVQSNLYGEHRPTGAVSGMDSYGLSRGTDVHIQETSTSVLQPSKVIDYGHTGKYTAGIGDEIGRKSDRDNSGGSKTVFMTGTAANRQNLEPLQKKITDSKSSALGSSHEQKSPFTSLSSPYSPAPSSVASTSSDQTKQMTKQAFQNILSSFQLPKKDTATRGLMSEASKPETQASSTSSHGMHPSGHGLVLIGDSDPSRTEDELSKTRNKMSVVIEHIMKHRGKQKEQMQQQMRTTKPVQKQPAQQQQSKGQAKQSKKKLPSKTRKGLPPDFGGSVPPSKKKPPTSKKLPKDKVDKDQPTPEMLYDYAAAPPRIFPHTCTLCYKDCANMQDWITHQNSSHHLESCTRLKKHYPKWDGEIVFGPRPVGKEAKPSTSTSAKKTKRTRSHSQSKSLSPKRRRGLEGKRRSRSPSPQSSKYSRRYDSPASPCYSSRSRSSERRLSPWRAADIRSPFRRSNDSRSPTRRVVVNRRSPPRRKSNETWSRDDGSRSPQRRGSQRWSPPRGFDERRSPQRRADDRHSPPRRVSARWSPSRRSDHSRSPQARSQERRSSREGSSPPKMGLNSAESLAKKLLETSAVQSLSNQSDLAAVVKTLAPALLAELAKMTSSSSTPSSSAAKTKLSKTVSSKVKSSSRTVELKNIDARLPDNDLSSLLGQFGKTKSIKINRSTKRAIVQYERLEAAENLRYAGSFTIKGIQVVVARGKIAATKSTQRKSSKSSASAPQTARLTRTTTSTKKPLLPTPKCPPPTPQPSGVIRKTTSKILSGKTAAKVLVSKAKNVSTKKVRKIRTLREMPLKGAAKTDPVTQNTTSGLEDMSQQGDQGTEQKTPPEESDSTSAADTVKVTEILKGTPMEEKISSSETETVQTVQEPEAAEEAVTPSISAASENQAGAGDSEDKPDKSGVGQSGTADAEKDTSDTATEAGKEPSTEAETTPTTQKPKEEPKPPGSGPEPSETFKETPQKSANVGKESRAESLKLSQSESKAPGSPEVQADTAESGKASPPTVVKLHGICSSLSHSDILSAVENFGKTKSVVLFRARLEAIVIFEKAEGAQKLRSVKSLNVNGVPVAVVGEKESVCKERKTPPVRQSTSESTTPKRITTTEEKAFTPEVKKTVKTEALAVEGLVKEQVTPTESKSSESLPVSGDSKQTLTPEKSKIATEESVVQLRDKDKTTEQVKGVKIKTETVSASAGESVAGENIGGTTAKEASEPTRTTSAPNNQPDVGKSEAVGQGENKNLIKAEDASEPMELKVQGITAEKPEDKERDKSAEDKPGQSPPPTGSDETQVTETSDKDGPASTAHGPETKTETAEGQQQEGGGTNEAAVEEAVPGGGAKTITTGKGPSAAVTTQIPSPSTKEVSKAKAGSQASAVSPETPSSSAKPAAAAASGQKPTTSEQPSAAVVCPTIGEMLKTTLDPQNIFCWSPPEVLPQRYPQYHRSVFISGLPLYHDGFYTEEDIVNLLVPFGFRSQDNKIFVIPQTGMAFATMPSRDTVMHLMTVSVTNGIYFRGIRLLIEVMHSQVQMLPLKFYMFMKRLLMCSVHDEGKRTVMIRNISQPDIRKLREALTEFAPITNFLPLLNKVFVEFKSVEDAGRFEKWYNQACPPPLSNVWRKRQVIMLAPAGPVTVKKAPQKAQSVPPVPKGKKVLVYKSGEIVFPQKPKAEGRKLVGSKAESNEKIEETAGEDPSVPSTSTESGEPDKSEGAGEPMEHEEQGVEGKAEAPKSDETASSGAVPESSSDKPKEKQDPGAEAKPAPKGTATTTTKDASKTASGGSAVSVEAPSSSSKPAAAASKQKKDSSSSSAVRPPTPGEMLEKRLFAHKIYCHALSTLSPLGNDRQLLLTGLPKFHDGLYTEDDVADLLVPFGFQDKEDKLFVVPQSRMAYAVMPSMKSVLKVLRESERNGIFLKEKKLSVRVVSLHYPMKALQFYTFVKRLLKCSVNREAERTVLIRNISQTEMKELREALQDYAPFNNFMPLLNKLYIEFNTYGDALRFKDWYSRRSHAPGHEVNMLKKSGPAAADKEPVQDKDRYFGETIENVLTKKQIDTVKSETANTPKMLITWLFEDCCCAEDDITELLTPFGYQHKDHNIYIFPQGCLAFVQMPTSRHVFDVLRASKREPIKLNGCELTFHAVNDEISLRPFWFYKFMMDLGNYPVTEDRDSIIFIRNISPAEIQELRDVLKKLNSVRNFWPLLNKVFIEFQTPCDADWLGVWYSLLKNPPNHRIQRLKIPHSGHSSSPAPKLPEDSQLDCKDLIEGATLPSVKTGVPQGSASPFWISLRNNPFVFPSISPWFIIPEYLTVKRLNDIERASRRGSMCPTVMLTGLPEGEYKHEDVARLVWPFFPKQDLRSLYYNVTVLPLQRRAFVFFADWMTCFDFVKAHITKRTSLKKRAISVHLVLQNMHPEFSEEAMYTNLMKLSNARVPDPASLEERLLCVEVSEVSLDVITLVVEMVASITSFVNFLPLANRICIEMADSASVAQVVERYNDLTPSSFTEDPAWSKVQNFETLESLRQRLQEAGEDTIDLEPEAVSEVNEPPETDKSKLKTITVTVGPHRLVRKSRSLSPERRGDANFTEDYTPADFFDGLQFNEDEFVTVDEVYDDVGEGSSERRRPSSSTHSSRDRRDSRASSGGGRTSSRSSKDHRSSASSSSSRSERTTRAANSSSERNASKPSRSSTKPSSSASASKSASPSPFVSPETLSSPDQRAKPSETDPPGPSSSSAPSETQPEQRAVPLSDHTASAEGPAAETVESETKMEARGEMHPPHQGPGFDLNQIQDMGIDLDRTNEDQKKDEEETDEIKHDDLQTLTPAGDQSAEQMTDGGQEGRSESQPGDLVLEGVKAETEESGEMDPDGPSQVLDEVSELCEEDDGSKTDQAEDKNGLETNAEEVETGSKMFSPESSTETPQGQTSTENQPLQEEDLKDPEGPEQTFEILDSIDDQTETEDDPAKLETLSSQTSKDDQPVEDEGDAYQVIDSVEDQPTSRQQRPRRGARRDDRSSRRSGSTNRTPKSDETEKSPKKQDKTDIRTKTEVSEDVVFEIVDSVEEEPAEDPTRESFGRRRSTRRKKEAPAEEAEKPEEVTYEILDSVETTTDEPTITTRSTRGRRGRPSKEATTEKMQREETPTSRRQTRSREKTPKTEETLPPKESVGEGNEEITTYEILDSVEDGPEEDQPAPRGRGTKGRPKKPLKTTKKDDTGPNEVDQETSEKVGNEEEATYQILDSVEDDLVDDRPIAEQPESERKEEIIQNTEEGEPSGAGSTKSEEEEEEEQEEPLFQVVDSLEEEQTITEASEKEGKDNTETGEDAVKEDPQSGFTTVSEGSEKPEESLAQGVRDPEEVSAGAGKEDRKETPRIDHKEEDSPSPSSSSVRAAADEEQMKSTLVNLDTVSDEEEDYSDDAAEEEELRKRQTAAKEKLQRARRSGVREEREQQRRRGGGGSRRGRKRGRVDVDSEELVTLDEVGSDDVEDEKKRQERGEESAGGEGRAMVTLDEFVEEEKTGQGDQKPQTLSQDEGSGEDLNHETLVTLDEADCDEDDNKPDLERTRRTPGSAKRNHDDDPVESVNFVIVDEVKDEENRETPKTRGRGKKRSRQTPVRKSTRGNTKSTIEEPEEEEKELTEVSNDDRQEAQETAENPSAAEPELQPESETLKGGEEEREGWRRVEVKVGSKYRREPIGPESKRSRSQSPSVPHDFKLPDFKPNNPLGKEFVVPGYFCNLCSVFYPSETTAKELHCSSQTHYNNLKKHFQKLQQKSGSSARSCPGSLSD
ncbi:uncharacterized protein LOC117807219 [Xyrichtys novacula]|uniref:Uncharacterized protein LOC117807219 n=1 Tax=Xyrichtys novacula TaxID=13765 RepID=A0AAV1HI92_XYRNO|nr:uncharacterized protein LOC117807219 [Xyrichtys novacula]